MAPSDRSAAARRAPGGGSDPRSWLVAALLLLSVHGVEAQRVRVEEELEAYPNEKVDLRCQFVNPGEHTKLTQVSWIWEPVEGQRDNIAVFHPIYGESFPNPAFENRVAFILGTLDNPSIRISSLRMGDAGRYTCEYATYPSGSEQGTTTLVMLAKPRNSVRSVTVQAGAEAVVVARCEAADGKPAASIQWLGGGPEGPPEGPRTNASLPGAEGTTTVVSEYRLVPTATDHGRLLTCKVEQRTQAEPWEGIVTLSVEYPPTVSIEGYDSNWYIGRSNAVLTCLVTGNPLPTIVTWRTTSGRLPDSAVLSGNRLTVGKVDEAANTTFVCEARNKLGGNSGQITTSVLEKKRTPSPPTGAMVGGILGSLAVIGLIVLIVFLIRKRQQDDGPPKHKPPPPVKAGSSTDMLNKPGSLETAPLSPGDVYYETGGGDPVTSLDDDAHLHGGGGALNGGGLRKASYDDDDDLKESGLPDREPAHHHDHPGTNIARGESFVSAAMYV